MSSVNNLKITKYTALIISSMMYSFNMNAFAAVEFNIDLLNAEDRKNIDLRKFSSKNYVIPGKYLVDMKINGALLPEQQVKYIASKDDENISLLCLTPEQVDNLLLKPEAREKVVELSADCLDITVIPGVIANNHEGILDITLPQAWLKYNDPHWVPPERWDHGVFGVIADYSFNGLTTHQFNNDHSFKSLSGYGQFGMNMGAWRLRAEYQASLSNTQPTTFDWNQIYAYRPLPMHAAKLMVGELFLDSQVFDSVHYRGIKLASDERMLPPALQGYAPEIRGIAKSNAKVTVSQNERVIYETTVPAGPFNIQDLWSSVRGTLDVKVEEQDGSVTTFQVETAHIPYLTRPGMFRYNTSIGRSMGYHNLNENPWFYVGDFSWGISNAWSLYGGLLLTEGHYQSLALGIGRDLHVLGAISADVTQSRSQNINKDSEKGLSFKLSYAKRFDEYHSSITFAGYRFSQKNFRSLRQYLEQQDPSYVPMGHEKSMYTITANKTFWPDNPDWLTNVFLTYTHQDYWNKLSSDRYGISLSRSFKFSNARHISTSLSLWQSDYQQSRDRTMMLNVSIPLGERNSLGLEYQHSGKQDSYLASYSDVGDINNSWRIRAGNVSNNKKIVDGYYLHRSQFSELTTNFNYQQDDYYSLGGSARGGVTITPYGAAVHNSSGTLNSSRVMISTSGVSNVPLNREQARSNHFGIAVIPDIANYHNFDVRVDVDAMDEKSEATKAISSVTLTEGAIGYQKFDISKGEKLMAKIYLDKDQTRHPPFGAEIKNIKGVNVSMVMDSGSAWILGVKPKESLYVYWDGKPQCQVIVPETINNTVNVMVCAN